MEGLEYHSLWRLTRVQLEGGFIFVLSGLIEIEDFTLLIVQRLIFTVLEWCNNLADRVFRLIWIQDPNNSNFYVLG